MPNATIKVKLPTGMEKIDVNLHKPVIFLNGQKRVLDKAWVFVNGEKKMLWGEMGVNIDYIQPSSDIGNIFAIGENWVDTSNSQMISLWDMSNLSNITLKESVGWGNVGYQNEYQSTDDNLIYFGDTSVNCNKMKLNPNTGELTVLSTINGLDNHIVQGHTNSATLRTEVLSRYFPNTSRVSSTVPGVTLQYGTNFYWNGTARYSTGRRPSSTSDSNYRLMISDGVLQIEDEALLINMSGTYDTGSGLYSATISGVNKLSGTMYGDIVMLDGDKICCANKTDFYTINKNNFSELYRMSVGSSDVLRFIGKLGGYYYLVKVVNYNLTSAEAKLILLDADDYSVAWEQDIPADPFWDYDGKGMFWYDNRFKAVIQNSRTGFLGAYYRDSSAGTVKIVRFSGLL